MMRIIVVVLLKKVILYRQVFLDFQKFVKFWWCCLWVCYKLVSYEKTCSKLTTEALEQGLKQS